MNTTNEMTLREMLKATIALLEGTTPPHNISKDEVIAKAKAEIAKLDATNAKRAEKAKEKAKENEPIKSAIFEFLVANGTKTTVEIATAVGVTAPKVSPMCRQMVDEGRLTASDVTVKGKGKQKAYTAIIATEDDTDGVVQATNGELNSMF